MIGVPDDRLGEEVCAFVRLQSGVDPKTFTRESVCAYSRGKLAYFKVPQYVIVIDAFPKTTSGKVQKFKLLKMFESGLKKKEHEALRA